MMKRAWNKWRKNKAAAAAGLVVAMLVVIAVTAPWLAPYKPLEISANNLAAPGADHWLGTDQLGRDIFSRILYGTRISLQVAGGAVAIALVVGTVMGLLAGYFGRWVDTTISRLTDVMFSLPDILLALVVMAILGVGLGNLTLAIGIVYTPIFARVCRGAVLAVKEHPYIEAARAMGFSHARILFAHVLPNVLPPLIVQTTLSLAFAILAEAALSFLGLSGQTDAPSWGLMLRQGKDFMELAWWLAVFPGLAITLTVLSFNIIGDGLQDVLDPRDSYR
jgi:peptide/nickel transport system permease protein